MGSWDCFLAYGLTIKMMMMITTNTFLVDIRHISRIRTFHTTLAFLLFPLFMCWPLSVCCLFRISSPAKCQSCQVELFHRVGTHFRALCRPSRSLYLFWRHGCPLSSCVIPRLVLTGARNGWIDSKWSLQASGVW